MYTISTNKKIAEWAEQNERLPIRDAEDKKENDLANYLHSIRSWLKKTKEVMWKEEVRTILEELDTRYQTRGTGLVQLTNAEKLKKWVEENGKLPSQVVEDKEEHRMCVMRRNLIKWINKSGEVKGEVIEQIKAIIEELDAKYKKKRTSQEIGQATFDAPVEQCDKASRHLQQLQAREVVH